MIIQGNKYICTPSELAEMLTKRICKKNPGETQFYPVNFSVISGNHAGKTEPEVVASGAEGWYGIRRIDTGFDDDGLTLCCNYYGGGYPRLCYFDRENGDEEIKTQLLTMIYTVLAAGENIIGGSCSLIAETCYVQPGEDPCYLDGPWRNDACKGYAIMAMERAGLDAETIRKVSSQMTWCFDDTTVKEAAQHYYGGRY